MVDIPAIFLGMPVTRKGIRRPSGNAYFRIATIRPEASRLSGKSCVAYNCSQHGTYLRLIENLRENLSVERLATNGNKLTQFHPCLSPRNANESRAIRRSHARGGGTANDR